MKLSVICGECGRRAELSGEHLTNDFAIRFWGEMGWTIKRHGIGLYEIKCPECTEKEEK